MRFSTTFSLVPQDYKQPVGNDIYLKMAKAGAPIKFIIVGAVIPGFSYWTTDKKCLRFREKPTETPGIQVEADGKATRVSHFWVIPVFDCATETVKLLEITQRSLQDQLMEIFNGGDYDLGNLDSPMAIRISAVGEKLTTKYTLMPVPSQVVNLMEKLEASDLASEDIDDIVFATPKKDTVAAVEPAAPVAPVMSVAAASDMM